MSKSYQTSMRVAVAGTCGLALIIAREIHESTSHQLIILSRSHQPTLISQGYQCQVVDYTDAASLQHSLMGIDTVISTVKGDPQLRLIEAAVACRVRRFAPAEFEGQPGLRSQTDTAANRSKHLAQTHLQYYKTHMQSTNFVCGVLYERFALHGMMSQRIGVNTGYGAEGAYIVDARNMVAEAPVYDSAGNLSYLCLTAAYDVGRFVVCALDMQVWPAEMSMCGERMSVNALVEVIKMCRGRPYTSLTYQTPQTLRHHLQAAQIASDVPKQRRLLSLIATAEGGYDFVTPGYLNALFPHIRPERFQDWFVRNWAGVL